MVTVEDLEAVGGKTCKFYQEKSKQSEKNGRIVKNPSVFFIGSNFLKLKRRRVNLIWL